jgi:hypothetical protein
MLSRYTVVLGERLELFKPRMTNIAAWWIVSLGLIAGGLFLLGYIPRVVYLAGGQLPADAKQGWSWIAVIVGSFAAIMAVIGGALLLQIARWLLAHEVEVCENGFRYREGKSCDEVGWSTIAAIRETVLYERPPLLKWPAKLLLPKLASTSYTVTTQDGREFGFSGDSINRIKRLGKCLRDQAERTGIPWEIVEEHA